MRSAIAILLAIALVLAACGNDQRSTEELNVAYIQCLADGRLLEALTDDAAWEAAFADCLDELDLTDKEIETIMQAYLDGLIDTDALP